jgi:3-methyladenine DNA glycosylase AlkD
VIPDDPRVTEVLQWLEQHGSEKIRASLGRYGIVAPQSFGIAMGPLQKYARTLGRDHALADALWRTGWYEARMLTAFVADARQLTPEEMQRWAAGFDNWAVCDTLCFKLFDRSPHAWHVLREWSTRPEDFVKRAAFALLASLALHDKRCPDEPFLQALPLIEAGAADPRNFVKKGVSWALRGIGRRNAALNQPALELARRLTESPRAAARWVGRDALKELSSEAVQRRLATRSPGAAPPAPAPAAG